MKENSQPKHESRSNTPQGSPIQGGPPRREYGERTDEDSWKSSTSRTDDKRGSEALEYGDRTDKSGVGDRNPHANPTQFSGKDQGSGTTRQDQQQKADAKSGQGREPARKGQEAERDAKPKSDDVKPKRT